MQMWKEVQQKEIDVGGYKCPCCSPVQNRQKSKEKKRLHRRARARLKMILLKETDGR